MKVIEMPHIFLSAAWRDLILVNYPVHDHVLAPYLPPGVELDRWEGSAYVSLVAFDFRETRVFGIPFPGHTDFPEINLRFYVRRGATRGVCFVREIVPQWITAMLARVLYNEPYVAAPIAAHQSPGRCSYLVNWDGASYRIAVSEADSAKKSCPDPESREHWFKEHEWGFGKARSGASTAYRVHHPVWDVYPGSKLELAFDFAHVYGPPWGFLNDIVPDSHLYAAGSSIKVHLKEPLLWPE